jgi:hypothetical protein
MIAFISLGKARCAMMLPKSAAVLVLLMLAGCTVRAGAPTDALREGAIKETALEGDALEEGSPKTEGCAWSVDSEGIAAEFRGLRTGKGHFQGGTWNADVDKWMGRKHRIMIQLGSRLGSGDCAKAEIIQLLGLPDLTARESDAPFDLVKRLPAFEKPTAGPCELLIYYWRGAHDFLYFTSQDETILNSGWWYAGE